PAAIDEVRGVLLDPVRQRAWAAFVDRAASPQGQTMSIGVLDPTDITYALPQGAQLRAGARQSILEIVLTALSRNR
ncbi:hypothetical protein ACV331_34805, partial [Pseudomonas aeruginosa]